jgi:Uma2 family endonuclease
MSVTLSEIELPIRVTTEIPMSDEEFMRFCAANEPHRFERDANGEILVMSPTGILGSGAGSDVNFELASWARADRGGREFGPTAGFKLADNSVRAADAAWVSWQRLNSLSQAELAGFGPICPEFVIEVRSKTDRLPVLQAKMEQWIANGAELGWLIDPVEKAVTIYRPGQEPDRLYDPSSVQGTGPVVGFELVIARVWG